MERQTRYWCHQCKHEFAAAGEDVKCPKCKGDFCEEITEQNNPVGFVPYQVRVERPQSLTRRIQQSWIINHGPGPIFAFPGMEMFQQNYLNNVLEYIRRIDPNRYGTPPASKQQISKLERIEYSSTMTGKEFEECSICKEKFAEKEKLVRMPCKHVNHEQCLIPWLSSHNSCPMCRYELKTDDPDYEQRRNRARR